MSMLTVRGGGPLRGQVTVPGDKSISHRALLLGALAEGRGRVSGFLPAADCLATLRCLQALGVEVEVHDQITMTVQGRGLCGFCPPLQPLDCGGSGTTMRLLAGILAGQRFPSVLTGNAQLRSRPMARVAEPLRRMGARVEDTKGHAPLTVDGGRLRSIEYDLPVASAQVKSAILLAGLLADGSTTVREPGPSRDHTERMLKAMGADLDAGGPVITLRPGRPLSARSVQVPGDISSAAFLLAALALPGSQVSVESVGVNPTRTGVLDILLAMGADIRVENERLCSGEPVADLTVRTGELLATEIGGEAIPRLIDELPLLALLATQAHGTTVVSGAAELRVKETDRIATTVAELRRLGAQIDARPDGFEVWGPTQLMGSAVHSHGDHRLAMTLVMAGFLAAGETRVQDTDCIADSFPGFAETLQRLGADVQ